MQVVKQKQQVKTKKNRSKRPFTKSDFETVLKVVTKPLKKKQVGKESGKT